MATVVDIVTSAYRRIGVVTEAQALTEEAKADAVSALNHLLDRLPSQGVGEAMKLRRVTASMTVTEPSILHVIAAGALTITLPEEPSNGFRVKIVDVGKTASTSNITIARNGWLIAGSSANVVLSTDGASKEYMFRADLGDWVEITRPLLPSAQMPFASSDDEAFSALLAKRLIEDRAKPLTAELQSAAQDGLIHLQSSYQPDMTVDFDRSLTRTPSQIRYSNYRVI